MVPVLLYVGSCPGPDFIHFETGPGFYLFKVRFRILSM